MKWSVFLMTLVFLLGLLAGCGNPVPVAQVAATTLPVYQFTATLCQGTGITVTRLVTESVSCLHDYSLNVEQVKALEGAQVVVLSGGGLEDFLVDLPVTVSAQIDSSAGISLIGCDHHHDHGHDHEADAHFWLAPENAMIMATNICKGLTAQFPEHSKTFEKNLQTLHSELQALQIYGESQLKNLACRELITFHDGFSYLAHAFDLTILEAIEEESGSEASAQELKRLVGLVEQHKLPAIFTEANGSTSAANIIAAETGAKLYTLDMAMAGEDYFAAMYHNIDTIKEALG